MSGGRLRFILELHPHAVIDAHQRGLIYLKAAGAQAPRFKSRNDPRPIERTAMKTDADLKRDVIAELGWDPAVKSTSIPNSSPMQLIRVT